EEAHKLSSIVFGLTHTKHLYSDHIATENIYMEVWEEEPMAHERVPKVREYREKTRANAADSHDEKKAMTKQSYLLQLRYEQQVIERYMSGNVIDLERLPAVEPFVRKLFLTWIGKAMAKADRTIKTEYGQQVTVILDPNRMIWLRSDDGHMQMPAVKFIFAGANELSDEPA